MQGVLRLPACPHGSELRLQPQRDILQGPEAQRSGCVHGRRRRRPRQHRGEHHRLQLQADGSDQSRRCTGAGRHEQLPERDRREEAPHPDLPHGGREPVQGRVPSGGDQPEDSGHHLRR